MNKIKRYRNKPGTPLDRDLDIIDLYENGVSIPGIVKTLKTTIWAVRKAIRRHGVKKPQIADEEDTIYNCEVDCAHCHSPMVMTRAERNKRMMHFCSRGCMTLGLNYLPNLGFEAYRLARYRNMTWSEVAANLGYSHEYTALIAARKYAKKNNYKWPLKRQPPDKKVRPYIKDNLQKEK